MPTTHVQFSLYTDWEKKTIQEGFSRNGLMSLEVNQKIEHIVFVVSCSEKRRMHDIKHLLLRVGMVIIGKSSSSCMLVMLVEHLYCNEVS